MKLRKIAFLSIASILSVGGLVACGNNPSPTTKIQITVSGPEAQDTWLKGRLAAYNAQRVAAGKDEIEFSTQMLSESDIDTRVTDWTTGPDIFAFSSDKVQTLYKAGALAQVPDSSADFIEETMGSASTSAATIAGKVLAYPYAADNGYFMYYNKAFWKGNEDKLTSIESMMEYAASIDANTKIAYKLELAFYNAGVMFTFGARYQVSLNSAGATTSIDADFNTEKGIKSAKAVYKISHYSAYANITDVAPTWDGKATVEAGADKYVACVDGSWHASDYKTELGENYACIALPTITIDGDTQPISSYLGYKEYGVNPQRHSTAEEMAIKHDVAKFLVNKDTQKARFTEFTVAPTNTELASDEEVVNTPHIKALAQEKAYAVPQTICPDNIWSAPVTLYNELKDLTTEPDQTTYQALMDTFNTSVKEFKK